MDIPHYTEFNRVTLLSAQMTAALDKAIRESTAKYVELLKGMKDAKLDDGLKATLGPSAESMQKFAEDLPKNELKVLHGIPPHFKAILLINEVEMTPQGPVAKPYEGPRPRFDALADPGARDEIERMGVVEIEKHFLFDVNMHPGFKPNVHITFPTGYRILSRINHIPMQYTEQEKLALLQRMIAKRKAQDPNFNATPDVRMFNKMLRNWQEQEFGHVEESQTEATNIPADPREGKIYTWPEGTLFLHLIVQREEKVEEAAPAEAAAEGPEAKAEDKAADLIAQLAEDAQKAGIEWETPATFQVAKIRAELNELSKVFVKLEEHLNKAPLSIRDDERYRGSIKELENAKMSIATYERDHPATYPWNDVVMMLYRAVQAFEHLRFVRLGITEEELRHIVETGADDKKEAKKRLDEIAELTKRYEDALRAIKKAYPQVQHAIGYDINLRREEKGAGLVNHNGMPVSSATINDVVTPEEAVKEAERAKVIDKRSHNPDGTERR